MLAYKYYIYFGHEERTYEQAEWFKANYIPTKESGHVARNRRNTPDVISALTGWMTTGLSICRMSVCTFSIPAPHLQGQGFESGIGN